MVAMVVAAKCDGGSSGGLRSVTLLILSVMRVVVMWSRSVAVVSWCFKPSQPQRILSGLKKTFMKRYVVERTNKAETRAEEQSEKAESCRENLRKEIQLKGP